MEYYDDKSSLQEETPDAVENRFVGCAPRRKRHIMRVILPILCLLVGLCLGFVLCVSFFGDKLTAFTSQSEVMNIVQEHYYYYDEEQPDLVEGMLKGTVDCLDDSYAVYYTAEEFAELTSSQSGNYIGMGVMVSQNEDGSFTISEVFDNTPASEVGIMAGDKVLLINGLSGDGLDLDTFLDYVSHEEGNINTLLLERDGQELEFTVEMREVYAPYVHYEMLDNNVGYIRLSAFHGQCVDEMKAALTALDEQGITSLVLDLRGNPGGSLSDVCDIADLFLDKGLLITSVKTRDGVSSTYTTSHDAKTTVPMVVLVNGDSASASELLSGALQSHDRATIIGTTTYGKGIVQSFYYVLSTGGYVKLTTEAYYTPDDVCIHGVGIIPDVTVKLPEEYQGYSVTSIPRECDTQLQAAINELGGN